MVSRAPKDGVVSVVNGQFYNGGEFTPDHGLFCGKDKNRVPVAQFKALAEKAASKGWEITYDEKTGEFIVKKLVASLDKRFPDLTWWQQWARCASLKTAAKWIPE